MPQSLTKTEWLELAKEAVMRPRLGVFLLGTAVTNTVKAGLDAPHRWHGFLKGYPFWRSRKRR